MWVLSSVGWGAQGNADTRVFDLPAGPASTTLKSFSKQSGRSIIAAAELVKDVRTHAVKGSFTASDAIGKMLAGTGLVASQDASGSFAIRMENARPNENRAALTASDRPSQKLPDAALKAPTTGSGRITGRVQNAVTGQVLGKARVTIRGTESVAYTDDAGIYWLINVPSGALVLDFFFTDLDSQAIPLQLQTGETITRDVALTSSARYGAGEPVQLNRFVVGSNKEADGEAIATNEKRFSANIKDVISTDSLGDILGGNVGEFMKYIPGVTAEYAEVDVAGLSVRGIGGGMTSITTDGAALTTANNSATRSVDVRGLALNNVSRIEVTKVPTPATPADSLAGSINMVTKSAFERSTPQLRWGMSLLGNSENVDLGQRPFGRGDRMARVIRPGADFDYTLPVNRNFGIVLTGMHSERFSEQHISRTTYATTGAGTGASQNLPYLQAHLLIDGPRVEKRSLFSFKADWRITRHSVLSLSSQWNRYEITIGNNQLTTNVGANGTPTPATGVPFSFGPDHVAGATGRGSATLTSTGNHVVERTTTPVLKYRFDDGRWRVEAGASETASKRVRDDAGHGSFGTLVASLQMPVRIEYAGINSDRPGAVRAYDASNREVDWRDIRNYRITSATAPWFVRDADVRSVYLNLRRRLNLLPFPTAVQVGSAYRVQTLDVALETRTYSFAGPDGVVATPEDATPYRAQTYVGQDAQFGFGSNLPWISAARAYQDHRQNPALFPETAAQRVASELTRITNSEYVRESVAAYYLQAEATLLQDRLKVLSGVRFEETTVAGRGMLVDPAAVYVRNADGTFVRSASGGRIRKPEAGAVGSMEELRLTRTERGQQAKRSYDGYFPSLHLTYSARENFLVRTAYAKTYGRPDFTDIIPRTVPTERDLTGADDPDSIRGDLNVRNTGLKPWSADNYDLSLEYYTRQGGLFSVGLFLKEIRDFFGSSARMATLEDLETLDLDPRYVGWNLIATVNAGAARITGAEFNLRHSLRSVASWGRYLTVFANGTKLRLEGNAGSNFSSFIPKSANWGVSFSRERLTIMAKWNYRGLDRRGPVAAYGPDGYEYIRARTKLDLNIAYQITSRISATFSAINIFNEPHTFLRYGSQTPAYARQYSIGRYGVPFSIGLKGTF